MRYPGDKTASKVEDRIRNDSRKLGFMRPSHENVEMLVNAAKRIFAQCMREGIIDYCPGFYVAVLDFKPFYRFDWHFALATDLKDLLVPAIN